MATVNQRERTLRNDLAMLRRVVESNAPMLERRGVASDIRAFADVAQASLDCVGLFPGQEETFLTDAYGFLARAWLREQYPQDFS